jgi:hypothetical protein
MLYRNSIAAIALAVACWMSPATAQVFDYGKYPDLKGQWRRFIVPGFPASRVTTRPSRGVMGNKRH